jgi:hypothetical protein
MAQRYWSGTIGGIALLDISGDVAGFTVQGAAPFESTLSGNTVQGASGFPHTQYSPLDGGSILEITFLHVPAVLLRDLLTLFNSDLTAYITCHFEDGFQSIDGDFKPNVPAWYDRGNPDGDYIENAIIRLIKNGA